MTAQPVIEADEMPAWLNNPPAAPTAAQRWGQRLMFAGAALLTIAVTAGATMLGLDLYESHSSMQVVAAHSQAAVPGPAARPGADAVPLVEKRASSLPPLVMLAPDPSAAHKKDAGAVAPGEAPAAAAGAPTVAASPAAVAPVLPPAAVPPAAVPPAAVPPVVSPPLSSLPPKGGKTVVEPPPVARGPQKAVAAPAPVERKPAKTMVEPSPVLARKVEKPVPPVNAVNKDAAPVKPVGPVKIVAQPPKKLPLAFKTRPKPSPDAVARKAAILAKRIATPVEPKAHARLKPVKGTMLQPPRERGLDPAFQDPPRQAIDRRCRPGELARECEARTR